MLLTLTLPTLPQRKGSMYGSTALIIASTKGYTETVNILISAGADLNAKATVLSFRQLVVIVISTFVFFYLHVKGGWTALMTACLKDHCDIVHLLTAAGADVDALTDVSDRDSLHHHTPCTHGHIPSDTSAAYFPSCIATGRLVGSSCGHQSWTYRRCHPLPGRRAQCERANTGNKLSLSLLL